MISGQRLRELRQAARISLDDMAIRCHYRKGYLSMIERGHRPVTESVAAKYSRVLGVGLHDEEVNRRTFIATLATTAANARLISDLGASLAGGDCGPLGIVQTSHAVDHAIAATLDGPTARRLIRWAENEANPIVRVNAAGIVAKLPGQGLALPVATVLTHDAEVRERYMRAVVARVLGVDHDEAAQWIAEPARMPAAHLAAQRLAQETISPTDAGARWCAATMLARMAPHTGESR